MNNSDIQTHQASYETIFQRTGLHDDARFYRWVARFVNPHRESRVLDVACGEGGLLAAVADFGCQAWGLDISATALGKIRIHQPHTRVVLGNSEQLPFASESFDYVTCLGSIENFAHPRTALFEMRRVLKSGGILVAMMPNKFWIGDILNILGGREEQQPFQRFERVATLSQWTRFL